MVNIANGKNRNISSEPDAERLRRSLEILRDISIEMTTGGGLDELLQKVVDLIVGFLKVKKASIMLIEEGSYLTIRASHGMPDCVKKEARVPVGSQISGWVVKEKKPLLIKDISKDERWSSKSHGRYESNSFLCVPMLIKDKVVGVINVNDKLNGEVFDQYDLELLTVVAGHGAAVVENYQLYTKLIKTIEKLNRSNKWLSNARKRMRVVMDHIVDAVVATDVSGKVIMFNKNAQVYFPEIKVGRSFFRRLPDENFRRWLKARYKEVGNGGESRSEFDVRYSDDKILKFKVYTIVIKPQKETISGYLNIFSDITHEKSIEERKREFLSIVSHELRTPVTVIKTYLSYMLKGNMGAINEYQKDCLETMWLAVNRLQREVENLMIMSKIEHDEFEPNIVEFDIRYEIFKHKNFYSALAGEEEVKIRIDINDSLPKALADPSLVRVALNNLLSNAIKFSKSGSEVVISCKKVKLKGYPYIEVSVIDRGPGISPKDIDRIFDAFEQVEFHLTRKIDGIGLGLAIVKKIVDKLDGDIKVDSVPGQGSKFSFYIRAVEEN